MGEELTPRQREEQLLERLPVLREIVKCLRGPAAGWSELARPHIEAILERLPRRRLVAILVAIPSKERYAALSDSPPSRQRRLLRAMQRDPDMDLVLRYIADQQRPIARRLRKGMQELHAFYLQALAIAWAAATGARTRVWLSRRERQEVARAALAGEGLETLVRRVLGRLTRKLAGAPARAALAPVPASQVPRVVRRAANGALNTAHRELRLVAEEFLFLAVRKALASAPRFVAGTRRVGHAD